mmetsp:Transcript_23167/g.54687  ORF Transcript_23167/g.54687 Transcript_23167/m.54687 type:complete len:125 (-) Transcript_23167:1351-1725(-)
MFKVRLFYVVVAICGLLGVAVGQIDADELRERPPRDHISRDQIVANYERRREHLRKLVEQHKEDVANHESGRKLLEQEEYDKFTKRIRLFQKKLDSMEGPMDEREIDRMMERTRMREERRHREL